MIKCEYLFEIFREKDLTFFSGVPDSILKDWIAFLADEHKKSLTSMIAVNECEAVALCAGYHLATGKIGIVYMQNSGEGKTVNPLTSLCDKEVYSIPLILMIGWRGEPGKKDEPQHIKMGRVTLPLLDVLEIPYRILPEDAEGARSAISEIEKIAKETSAPAAIIIREGLFEKYKPLSQNKPLFEMSREDALKLIVDHSGKDSIFISTTGKTSRELFEYRVHRKENPCDFYTVGSMGCSSSIANALALSKPDKKVFILDGDGAALMQLGALATIGHYNPKNLFHIIFDNRAYDSTGGQPTVSSSIDFEKIAHACNYAKSITILSKGDLISAVNESKISEGPQMIVVKVNPGSRQDLGRPTKTAIENKKDFMESLI